MKIVTTEADAALVKKWNEVQNVSVKQKHAHSKHTGYRRDRRWSYIWEQRCKIIFCPYD